MRYGDGFCAARGVVGDDREHLIDVDDLTVLAEADYCSYSLITRAMAQVCFGGQL